LKQIIDTNKSIDAVFELFKNSSFESLACNPFCSGYLYLDNGYGKNTFVDFSIEVQNNKVIVSMLKKDVPYYWQWQFDYIFDDAIEKVKGALEN
jgi:hypothetical protein